MKMSPKYGANELKRLKVQLIDIKAPFLQSLLKSQKVHYIKEKTQTF